MYLIHKLLFSQRVKSKSGKFFDSISSQIEETVGQITEVSYACAK